MVSTKLMQWCKEQLKDRDSSHDWKHHIRVMILTKKILDRWESSPRSNGSIFLKYSFEEIHEITSHAAAVHDIPDYKYIERGQSRETVLENVKKALEGETKFVDEVLKIIENISWSKEKRGELEDLGALQLARDIVSDADKLDALGNTGLQRCFDYQQHLTPSATTEVILQKMREHCKEKLCSLSDYIRTEPGQKLAKERQRIIQRFYTGNSSWYPKGLTPPKTHAMKTRERKRKLPQ